MRTLVLDTSGPFTTVVVVEDGGRIAGASFKIQALCHLHATIRAVLALTSFELSSVERIAVVIGPGSWTGLNIGVTAAKTLAQVLALPLVALTSLDALVAAERWLGGPVYGILDAKRSNVYCGAYATGEHGTVMLAETSLELLSFTELSARLGAAGGRPLVVEYGDRYRGEIERDLPRVCVTGRGSLSCRGLAAALRARQDRTLDREEIMDLSPLYLQQALGERAPGARARGAQTEE